MQRRKTMYLITPEEAQDRTIADLVAFFDLITTELGQAEPGSPEMHRAVASLINIRNELARRRAVARSRPQPRGPGF
jgi:hypothetical protein